MNRDELEPGDYVVHRTAPKTLWRVLSMDPWTPDGGQATLSWAGGDPLTSEVRGQIFNVFRGNSSVSRIRDLREPNPMFLIATVVK